MNGISDPLDVSFVCKTRLLNMYRTHLLEDYYVHNLRQTWSHMSREKWVFFISLTLKLDSDKKATNLLFASVPATCYLFEHL